ncbi:MAG: peptidase inhibitor family I36 protein, partial [Actinomycetota bacterium]
MVIRFRPKASWSDCDDGNLCLYSHQQFSGDLLQLSSCCGWINLGGFNFANTTSSWRNRRNNDSLL